MAFAHLTASSSTRCLLVGWFSTIGDLDALQQTISWIDAGGGTHVVAPYASSPIRRHQDYVLPQYAVDPTFTHLVAICGPMWRAIWEREGFSSSAFAGCRKVGLNLSMIEDTSIWNPFEILIERDSASNTRADLAFLAPSRSCPVAGICLVHQQAEYADRQRHAHVARLIQSALQRRQVAVVTIGTDTPNPGLAFQAPPAIEAIMSRVDVLITTRLHGMVYALRNGVPPVVIDPIAGGAKVSDQARTIGWRHIITADMLTEDRLIALIDHCLSPAGRQDAAACLNRAIGMAGQIEAEFTDAVLACR